MRTHTRVAAHGKWRAILQLFLPDRTLSGKHTACPICHAEDKFRFTDYKSGGEWICTHGTGDGFDLLIEVTGMNFKGVAKKIDEIIGNNELPEVFQPEVDYESRRRNLNKVWAGATSKCHLDYLWSRNLGMGASSINNDLRGHDALWNADIGKRVPAMVALIRNKDGVPISIHRTFFDPKSKKIMPPTEKIIGGGIRLGLGEGETLVVGEGVETTLSGMEYYYRSTGLAAISANGMEALIIPKEFKDIIILSDSDRSFTGQKAAFTLARRMDQERRGVTVVMSPSKGEDFLDMGLDADAHALEWNNVR